MLCWHHVVPEMNHNELLGWRVNTDKLGVVYFRNSCDYDRNQVRIDINKEVLAKYTDNISEVWSKGVTKHRSWRLSARNLNEVKAFAFR